MAWTRAQERLVALLAAQDDVPGSVQLAAKPATALRLEVDGLGAVPLPLTDGDAARLRALGQPARYGRGEQTLTDRTVRDTWEVPRELVHAEWAGPGLPAELEDVREELGLPAGCRLTAELHALLVYEPGQFFVAHQDSEKDDAMVATLVVTLPSVHSGGELVVHHLGEATTYKGLRERISLVAFYADCRHEVRPVTAGHRVTLTYNLLLDGDATRRPSDQATIAQVAGALRDSIALGEPLRRLAVLLDHEYTERGLAASRLKGDDARSVSLLRAAADAAGFESVLALTDVRETWDALVADEPDTFWDEDDPDVDGAGADHGGPEVSDLLDGEAVLTWWADVDGSGARAISVALRDDEVCAVTPSASLTPYASQCEGYMGNYGNTVDRWYRRAALVLWPQESGFVNRADAAPLWAMEELTTLARTADPAAAADAARTLAPVWPGAVRADPRPGELLAGALAAAVAADEATVAAALLSPFAIESVGGQHAEALAEVRRRYGDPWLESVLSEWFNPRPTSWPGSGLSRDEWLLTLPGLCNGLCAVGLPGATTARDLVRTAWPSLLTLMEAGAPSWTSGRRRRLEELGPALAALLRAAESLEMGRLLDGVVTLCGERGGEVAACVLAALREAAPWARSTRRDDVFARLAADQAARLTARLAEPARNADDWSLTLPAGCGCLHCQTLGSFLADSNRRTLDWPLAKEGRLHVHRRVEGGELPVTHRTRRTGSPYTLVLTKTPELFEREARHRARHRADLEWLRDQWPGQSKRDRLSPP